MTVIVWDGKTLAADRRAITGEYSNRVKKIRKIRGHLVGGAGTIYQTHELMRWFGDGAEEEKFPRPRSNEEWARILVITPDKKILEYSDSPLPIVFKEKVFAVGEGSGVAWGVLEMGGDAVKAVKIASLHVISCGGGVDTLTFEDDDG